MDNQTQVIDADELESSCETCLGKGGWWEEGRYRDWHRCGKCEGSGYLPTDLGKRILSLMRHNFKPMLEDSKS